MSNFKGRVKTNKMDNYNTPLQGWRDILSFFDKDTKLWLPFYNDGTAKDKLNELGYMDIYHADKDFFTYWLDDRILIDNPPFSIKQKVIDYAYKHNKPFALLLPFDTIERKYFKQYSNGLQIIIPQNRYNYTNDKGQPPFKSVWLCWNLSLGNREQIIFL